VEEHYLQALRWYNEGNAEQAKEELHQLLSLDPDSAKGEELLEMVHRLEIKKMSGIQRLKRANDAFSLALKEYRSGRYDPARMRIEEVLVLNPQHQQAQLLKYLIRTRQLLEEGKVLSAKERLMDALKINPDYPEAVELYRVIMEKERGR